MSWGRGWLGRGACLTAAGILLATGLGCLLASSTRDSAPRAADAGSVSVGTPPTSHVKSASGLATARSVPVRITIPRIHVSSSLGRLGLNADGTVQVPSAPGQPGWYRLGPTPGEPGSAVILGHVDSVQGPAVFYQLSALRPGDTLAVQLADGRAAHFRVTAIATYLNADFPAKEVYGSHGYSGLQLVTCGDGFDTSTQEYLGNVVVYTRLTSTTPAPKGIQTPVTRQDASAP